MINLREVPEYVVQYVELRNRNYKALISSMMTVEDTREWLAQAGIEVRCIVEDGTVAGAIALNSDRGGELTFFAAKKNTGIGTELIAVMEKVGRDAGLEKLWAWTAKGNVPSRRAFEKNGFRLKNTLAKEYDGKRIEGVIYEKSLSG